jgi:uncharacterized protein (TIGR03435 family)
MHRARSKIYWMVLAAAVSCVAAVHGPPVGAGDAQAVRSDSHNQADAAPAFEVATIKPSDPKNCCGYFWNVDGMRFRTANTNLRWLIRFAYGLNDKQIVGQPGSANDDLYDVEGAFSGTKPPTDLQCRVALQKLLVERFGLKFHHESREMSAYVLTAPRGSTKLTRSDPKVDTEQQLMFSRTTGKTMHGTGRDVSLRDFAAEIQRLTLNRPLVDRTGITGTFDIDLEFTWEDPNSLGMAELPDNAPPNLLTALNEQLGLKLQTAKTPVDVLVIDHAEPPSAN